MVKSDLKLRTGAVAAAAGENAEAVDRDSRFPAEAFAAARNEGLLSILVPADLGGEGATLSDVVNICYLLGRSCASTAMIFAMHQIMVAILVRHAGSSSWHRDLLRRLSADELLLASSTTEGEGGGDLRTSACSVQQIGSRIALVKDATVVSYGQQADAILTTARRSPDSPPSDQVVAAFMKEDYKLEQITSWDTLGMRGTCSPGVKLNAGGEAEQIIPEPYQNIHTRTMMPVAHLTWSAVWAGIAADAFNRTRQYVRGATRRAGGQLPPSADRLTQAGMSLRSLRMIVASALHRFEAATSDELGSLDFQNSMNLLKVKTSEIAIGTVMSSLQACGLTGYRNDTQFSIARHVRDILSSSVMINNDRILASARAASLLTDIPLQLTD